jgi:hypothetical protein
MRRISIRHARSYLVTAATEKKTESDDVWGMK